MSVPSLSALLTHERMTVASFVEQHEPSRAALLAAAAANPQTSGPLLVILRTLHEGIEVPATAPANPTAKPITCPDCGTEIAPDDSARMDVLAALDAYAQACTMRNGPPLDIHNHATATRARLLALLGIADR